MFPHFQAVAFYVWQLKSCSNNIEFLLCLEKHHPFKNIICHNFIAQWIDLLWRVAMFCLTCYSCFLDMKFLYKFKNAFAFHGWSLFGKVTVEGFWLTSTCRRAFKKSFLYVLIVVILSQSLERLHCLEVLSLFCHQPYLLNPNECEKWEKSGFAWLFQQCVENGQIAGEDDSLGNLNSPASSSVGT